MKRVQLGLLIVSVGACSSEKPSADPTHGSVDPGGASTAICSTQVGLYVKEAAAFWREKWLDPSA